MEPGRPVGGAYYLYRTLRQLDVDGLVAQMMEQARRSGARSARASSTSGSRARSSRPAQGAAGADRGGDPPPARRRPRRRGDGAHAAQAAARRRRLHARVARGDARAAAGDLPAHARARGPARAAAPAPPPRPPRLPPDRARTRCRTAACRPSRSSSDPHPSKPEIMVVADISGSVASFARFTLQFVYAMESQFSKVRSWVFIDGIDEVTRFFERVRRRRRGGPPGQHRSRRRLGRRPLRLRPRVRDVARAPLPRGHAEDVDHPARRRAQQLPRVAGVGARRDAQARPATSTGSTPSRAATGTPATRSSPSTRPYCDGVYECRNLRQLQQFVTHRSPKADAAPSSHRASRSSSVQARSAIPASATSCARSRRRNGWPSRPTSSVASWVGERGDREVVGTGGAVGDAAATPRCRPPSASSTHGVGDRLARRREHARRR